MDEISKEYRQTTIVCFGEVLWDVFPSGEKEGGAPFNVAYNLKKMGVDAHMISRVGDDDLGKRLITKIASGGIPTDSIQKDIHHPTSTVQAIIDEDNEAHYEIFEDVAWDYIEKNEDNVQLVSTSEAFVFGSLATRQETTRNTLFKLMENARFNVFDVNLRAPFIDIKRIQNMLQKSNMAKMNKAELKDIFAEANKEYTIEEDSMKYIQDKYQLDGGLLVTKGSKGAVFLLDDTFYRSEAIKVQVADTVGSGDSFLAGFLSGKFLGLNKENQPLYNACELGAFITSQYGACPEYNLDDFEAFKNSHETPNAHHYPASIKQ